MYTRENPSSGICEQQRRILARTSPQSDRCFCCLLIGQHHIKTCYKRNFTSLARNPKDRFCCVKAHIKVTPLGLTPSMLHNFASCFCCILNFFTVKLKKCFKNTNRVPNSLDQEDVWYFIVPDLGQICLQRLSIEENNS